MRSAGVKSPEDGAGDSRRARILAAFRCGARRPWCRQVWKTAIKACGGTQDDAAQRLFVTTSAVSEGLQHGRLSIETLIVMMAELAPEGWRMPKSPPRDEMMAEGLIEAMAFLREPKKTANKRHRISHDDLAHLAAVMGDKEWAKALADLEHALAANDDVRLRRAKARLASAATHVASAFSRTQRDPINRTVEQLLDLSHTWSAAWIECRQALPFDWDELS